MSNYNFNKDEMVLNFNSIDILSTKDLLDKLYKEINEHEYDGIPINPNYEEIKYNSIAFIGWPNVGKSSIINSIQN